MSLAEIRRGINLVGMEGLYGEDGAGPDGERWDNAHGPRRGKDYPIYSQDLVRYYREKKIAVVRLPFSWERLQSALAGPVPGDGPGYADYFSDFVDLVDFMTSLDIVVIVEPWQAGADGGAGGLAWRGQPVGSEGVPTAAFVDLWAKVAGLFKANSRVEYGLVNEPHDMSTMDWWSIAQQCVDQIRASGATTRIYVPGNGYSAASTWAQDFYDTAVPARSNAYGWLNAKGVGQPLTDPLARTVAEVHLYLDPDAGGSTTQIVRPTIARERLTVAVEEAAANGYQVFVGEIGCYSGEPFAGAAWGDFVAYATQVSATCLGYTWWAAGDPEWWADLAASGGGHFALTPQALGQGYADTANMMMVQNNFG